MRLPRPEALLAATLLVCCVAIAAVQWRVGLDWRSDLGEGEVSHALSWAHQLVCDSPDSAMPAKIRAFADEDVAVVLTAWRRGRRRAVAQDDGGPLTEALPRAAAALRSQVGNCGETRLQLDVAVAEGWLPQDGLLRAMGLVDGRDGIVADVGGHRVWLPPGELVRNYLYGGFRPSPRANPTLQLGVRADSVEKVMRRHAKALGYEGDIGRWRRFRAVTAVEGADGEPLPLRKSTVKRQPLNRVRTEAAARAGADWLVRGLRRDGRFRYQYNATTDKDAKGYVWERHAGVAYSLALTGRLFSEPDYLRSSQTGLETLMLRLSPGPEGSLCLKDGKHCRAGLAALTLLALAEYRIATSDERFDESAAKIADFLMVMQRPDGSFRHRYNAQRGINEVIMSQFVSQQAVFALARQATATGDETTRSAAILGMDFLAGPYWDHFLGTFFVGMEHWSCLAAEEAYKLEPKAEYADFCLHIGRVYARFTLGPAATPYPEDVGGTSFTQVATPSLGGTATTGEALVSAVAFSEGTRHEAALRLALERNLNSLYAGQVTDDDTLWLPNPGAAMGGIYESTAHPTIRMDTVQHAISALARSLAVEE